MHWKLCGQLVPLVQLIVRTRVLVCSSGKRIRRNVATIVSIRAYWWLSRLCVAESSVWRRAGRFPPEVVRENVVFC